MSEKVVVWITKYALSGGVVKEICEIEDGIARRLGEDGTPDWWRSVHGEGKHWHRTRESAEVAVAKMKVAKIKSLEKQIDKLRKPIEVPA